MRLVDRLRTSDPLGGMKRRGQFGPYSWPAPPVSFNGIGYGSHELIHTTLNGKTEDIANDFAGYVNAVKQVPPAFAAQNVRSLLLSQVRFAFRNKRTRATFGASPLDLLERPWPKGTTGELVSKMEWHEGLAGNAYVFRDRVRNRLKVLRPDWVTIILGSEQDPEEAANQLDAELVAFAYKPGGHQSKSRHTLLLPQDVAHWSPLPDPEVNFRGMSWLTPAIRELQGDLASADHKLAFFRNGATPNLVVNGLPTDPDMFGEMVDKLNDQHEGVANAYRTLYLSSGADATVVGSDLKQIDFKATQGAGETRISVLSRVPAPVLGISEGLAGSSLNAGNYGQSRRNLSDGWLAPTLQSLSAALGEIADVPLDAELWYTTEDMPFVREDAKDAAEIEQLKAAIISSLVREGFTPPSAIAAVLAQDMSLLEHTGMLSVQLQKPGATPNEGGPSAE